MLMDRARTFHGLRVIAAGFEVVSLVIVRCYLARIAQVHHRFNAGSTVTSTLPFMRIL